MKQDAKRLLLALWIKACWYDGVDHRAKFVCFTDGNPYEHRRQKIMRLILEGSNR